MRTADELRTPQSPPADGHTTHRHGRWPFLRHYLEMVAAMVVGMLLLGPALDGVLILTGLELPDSPELGALEMATTMSLGMVAWMRYRGHGWASTLEMTAAMFAPLVVLLPLLWLGAITADLLILLEHVVMLPLMWLAMLRRRSEYGGASHG